MEQTTRIAGESLEAEIAPLGAELQRLTHCGQGELLWGGDPAIWSGRAPLLFPIVGTLNGDSYRHAGHSYTLAKHGFARRSTFTRIDGDASSATFRLEPNAETRAAYPFEFRLDIRFAIVADALEMEALVSNRGDAAMPASFGYHPALRWPLPYGAERAAHRLRFAEPEAAPIRRIDATGALRPDALPTPVEGRDLMLRDALFEDDAIIFDSLRSHSLIYGASGAPGLAIDFPDTPQLGVWTKPGAGYVCVEPWQGFSDPQGFAGDIADKPGIVMLAPAEERRFRMRIGLRPGSD